MRFFIVAMGFALNACGLFPLDNQSGKEVVVSKTGDANQLHGPAVAETSESPQDLVIAKLTARVEELETQLLQHRERMALIEKGLMLGIVPEELKRKEWKFAKKSKKDSTENDSEASELAEHEAPLKKPTPQEVQTKSKDVTEYRRLVQQAQDKFNSAHYGQAIAIFNDIGEKFDDSLTEGSHHYWVGLGWYYLKESQLAEQSLNQLKDHYPQNRWVPYSRFYLAKIDQARGLQNRALDQMRKLMEEFPQQDIGEMARQEVQKMRESL